MKKLYTISVLLFVCAFAYSQNTITGTFHDLANKQITLVGYNCFDTYIIDSTKANKDGEFELSYSKQDFGMGYLLSEGDKPYIVILDEGEYIQLRGQTLELPETVKIIEGLQNQLFEQYAYEHMRREQTLSAWNYLEKIYLKDTLFAVHDQPKQAIEREKKRIKVEDSLFLDSMDQNIYAAWYLQLRKLVSSVAAIAQYRTQEIPATIEAFRTLEYTDNRMYKSGLVKESLEAHFWLIENSGRSLDSVYLEMYKSIDILYENLLGDELKLNEITEYLFKMLEQRSLVRASEYLALKLLNEQACTINDDFSTQLESYRKMKKGNIAPDIEFNDDIIAQSFETADIPKKLSALESDYTVVVFGASWCPTCPQELLQIAGLYEKWKQYGMEVVFVSLDVEKQIFNSFVNPFPFISLCDYQKWESPSVKNYFVFATPTIYLLDKKRKILLRPNSVRQLDAWVDWSLVQGNKK